MLSDSSTACIEGCYFTSKIGIKYGALNSKRIYYLKTFGKNKDLCHKEADKAASYLVKVLHPFSASTTRDGFLENS